MKTSNKNIQISGKAVNTRSPKTTARLVARQGSLRAPPQVSLNSVNGLGKATVPGRRATSVARSGLEGQSRVQKEGAGGGRGRESRLLTNSPYSQLEAWSTFPPANREGDPGLGGALPGAASGFNPAPRPRRRGRRLGLGYGERIGGGRAGSHGRVRSLGSLPRAGSGDGGSRRG